MKAKVSYSISLASDESLIADDIIMEENVWGKNHTSKQEVKRIQEAG